MKVCVRDDGIPMREGMCASRAKWFGVVSVGGWRMVEREVCVMVEKVVLSSASRVVLMVFMRIQRGWRGVEGWSSGVAFGAWVSRASRQVSRVAWPAFIRAFVNSALSRALCLSMARRRTWSFGAARPVLEMRRS